MKVSLRSSARNNPILFKGDLLTVRNIRSGSRLLNINSQTLKTEAKRKLHSSIGNELSGSSSFTSEPSGDFAYKSRVRASQAGVSAQTYESSHAFVARTQNFEYEHDLRSLALVRTRSNCLSHLSTCDRVGKINDEEVNQSF